LKFNTLVTPYREVVDQSDIEQYQLDVEQMVGRSTSVFPSNAGILNYLGWEFLIYALILVGIIAWFFYPNR